MQLTETPLWSKAVGIPISTGETFKNLEKEINPECYFPSIESLELYLENRCRQHRDPNFEEELWFIPVGTSKDMVEEDGVMVFPQWHAIIAPNSNISWNLYERSIVPREHVLTYEAYLPAYVALSCGYEEACYVLQV